jgi:hypothetical protein
LKNKRVEQVLPRNGGGGGEVAQTMCAHVNKCKNNKKKRNETNINDYL